MPSDSNQAADNRARQPPEYLAVGRVVRPHGIRGAVKVESGSDLFPSISPSTTIYIGESRMAAVVTENRPYQAGYLLFLEGFRTRNQAESLREQEIYLRFEEIDPLPEGVYYQWQVLGLEVETEEGEVLGVVDKILETGANDVYLVRRPSGGEVLLPAIGDVILEIDLEQDRIIVKLLPGLIDEGGDGPQFD
jgi:16S rRNA processing protein RimM